MALLPASSDLATEREPLHEVIAQISDVSAASEFAWAFTLRVEVGEIALADKSAEIAVDVLTWDDRGKGFEKFGKIGVMGGFFQSDYLRRRHL